MTSPSTRQSAEQLSDTLRRNIRTLQERRAQEAKQASAEERVAEAITSFTGSMLFVYLHVALYGGWILINLGIIPVVAPFDPTFVVLAMIASVEAIFLSTFVLISQNRMAATADKRADLNLQISLLTEHELTRLAAIVAEIAERLDAKPLSDEEISEIKSDVEPEAVLNEIEAQQEETSPGGKPEQRA